MNDEPKVITTAHDGVLVITINRPKAKNAVDAEVAQSIAAAVDRLDAEPTLCAGILTGAGDTFSAGFDLNAFLRGETATIPGRGFAGIAEKGPAKPLIAAVEGWALAGGFEMAMSCDLIVASREASFGLPEVKRGLVAAGGGLVRLPRRLPYHVAMLYALTGDTIPATVAARNGMVNVLCEPGQAVEEALALAKRITANGPLALAATKRILSETYGAPEAEAFELTREIAKPVFASADAKEGALAFTEKRSPRWQGR